MLPKEQKSSKDVEDSQNPYVAPTQETKVRAQETGSPRGKLRLLSIGLDFAFAGFGIKLAGLALAIVCVFVFPQSIKGLQPGAPVSLLDVAFILMYLGVLAETIGVVTCVAIPEESGLRPYLRWAGSFCAAFALASVPCFVAMRVYGAALSLNLVTGLGVLEAVGQLTFVSFLAQLTIWLDRDALYRLARWAWGALFVLVAIEFVWLITAGTEMERIIGPPNARAQGDFNAWIHPSERRCDGDLCLQLWNLAWAFGACRERKTYTRTSQDQRKRMSRIELLSTVDRQMVETIVRVLRPCRSILFVTGAGISADSGLPTYRGIGGLYDVDSTEEGYAIEEVLSGEMLQRDPQLTWKYLAQIADAARGASFNRGHEVIAEMEQALPRVWTLTQNVDGFHRQAGSENVVEIHGNMHSLTCMECGKNQQVQAGDELDLPPQCPNEHCCGITRPDVVLFGEMLPAQALETLQREGERGFDAVINVGTSGQFPYIQEPTLLAKRFGIPTIEINPGKTILSPRVDYRLAMSAAAALDVIWEQLQE